MFSFGIHIIIIEFYEGVGLGGRFYIVICVKWIKRKETMSVFVTFLLPITIIELDNPIPFIIYKGSLSMCKKITIYFMLSIRIIKIV